MDFFFFFVMLTCLGCLIYFVPTGLKCGGNRLFYQYPVPTGLTHLIICEGKLSIGREQDPIPTRLLLLIICISK